MKSRRAKDLRAALGRSRMTFRSPKTPGAAMQLLEQENFAVLLTDFRLPKEDGMKLIARAKSLSKPPICILMTAYGSEELAVEAMKNGADDYIAKGRLQIDELEMRIGRAIAPAQTRSRKRFAPSTARHAFRHEKHHRAIAGDGGNFRRRPPGCPHSRDCLTTRRKRHRQRTHSQSHSPTQSTFDANDGHDPLRRPRAIAPRKRTLRP